MNKKSIKFYLKGRYMGYRKMNPDHALEVNSWILSGGDIKIGDIFYNSTHRAVNDIIKFSKNNH